ncbi:MAG: hypothetical protein Fur006_24440 [Coleofasciculaceae cyanobacterium]
MELPVDIETSSSGLPSFQNRYILTRVGHQKIGFPSQWVAEIMLIERSQILNLPFYDSRLLGVVHYQGHIVPLIAYHFLLSQKLGRKIRFRAMKEILTVIRLSQAVDKLAGVGILVEQVVGSLATEKSPEQSIFQLSDVPDNIWQPHWYKADE